MAHRAKLVAQGAAIGLVVLLFVLLAWSLVGNDSGGLAAAAARGERPVAPDFTAERLDRDGEQTLAALRGQAVAVNFWASWCIPCKDEAPFLEQVWRENRARGLVVLGAAWHDLAGDSRRFMRRYGLTFPVVDDGSGDIGDRFGVRGVPETYVLDREGRVVEAFVGAINTDEDRARMRAAVERALGT